jgi:hypothetical protein
VSRLELAATTAVVGALAALIKAGVALAGHSIAWWLAALIAAVLVYGGFLIIDGDWID